MFKLIYMIGGYGISYEIASANIDTVSHHQMASLGHIMLI